MFSLLTCPHGFMCIRIYIFCFKQKKKNIQTKTKQKKLKKIEKQKKPKEEKEKENVFVVNNICGKSNGIQYYRLTYWFCVLLTYLISEQKESVC